MIEIVPCSPAANAGDTARPRSDVREALRAHLAQLGLRTDLLSYQIEHMLRASMGSERYRAYRAAADRYSDGITAVDAVYRSVRTLAEANLLMSRQGDVALRVNAYLAEQCLRLAPCNARVMDVGCWTGGLASFLARKRSDLRVVGVDRLTDLIAAATTAHRGGSNLSFRAWDYAAGPLGGRQSFEVLLCAMGVDLDERLPRTYGPITETSPGYRTSYHEVLPCLAHWRLAARRNALLLAVLRITCPPHLLALVDAAHDVGWSVSLAECGWIGAGDQQFPALTFYARRVKRVSARELLAWCMPSTPDLLSCSG